MHTEHLERPLSNVERRELASEIRREIARVQRALAHADTTDELDELTQALARLSDGSYGRCVACGEWIAYGRLLVMPAATTCVGCR
jgi:RNA polymerase-binding transcription factor DksA